MFGLFCRSGLYGQPPADDPPEPELTYYTVIFDSQGGSPVESQRVRSGNPVRRPDTPTRDGHTLRGWYKDAQATDRWDFDTDRVNANRTLYAGWDEESSLEPTESLVFVREGDSYIVTDMGDETAVVIPAEHEGLPVTAIRGDYGTGAFARKDIVSAVIPDSVVEIGQNTFNNCDELVSVSISENSSLQMIGNNAFSGCSSLKEMYLPAGATQLGSSVFNNCGALEAFTVAEGNTAYRAENGHLIERETNTLIRGGHNAVVPDSVSAIAQAAFRRTSGITELYIPVSVTEIGKYFIADSSIAKILYRGTEAQWNAIEKSDTMWNYGNREVVLEYSAEPEEDGGILVVYFSATGNTEGIAEIIAEYTGAATWEILAADPYTAEDLAYSTGGRADREQDDDSCSPEIAATMETFDDYDTIFIGHPIWHGIAPRIIQTFLEGYDFEGKDVYTFSTSASSSGSGAFSALARQYTSINLIENLHFTSSQLSSAQTRIESWLTDRGFGFEVRV